MSAILPLSGDEQTSGYDPKMTLMTRSGLQALQHLFYVLAENDRTLTFGTSVDEVSL
jgi:hypothetical protein